MRGVSLRVLLGAVAPALPPPGWQGRSVGRACQPGRAPMQCRGFCARGAPGDPGNEVVLCGVWVSVPRTASSRCCAGPERGRGVPRDGGLRCGRRDGGERVPQGWGGRGCRGGPQCLRRASCLGPACFCLVLALCLFVFLFRFLDGAVREFMHGVFHMRVSRPSRGTEGRVPQVSARRAVLTIEA